LISPVDHFPGSDNDFLDGMIVSSLDK
jgi:hypothetical protein